MFACKDYGCTEADDFGEFTTANLQFPQYASTPDLYYNKTLCNEYNQAKLKLANITVEACTDENNQPIIKNCTDVNGNDKKCDINFSNVCPSVKRIEFDKKCFAEYRKLQTSSGGESFVIAKNDSTYHPNFYLFPRADISVKIRGEISINRAGDKFDEKIIEKDQIINESNAIEVTTDSVTTILLKNKESNGQFFNFNSLNWPNSGSSCALGANKKIWEVDFLNSQQCSEEFKTATQLIDKNLDNNIIVPIGSDTIQDTLKQIIVQKIPYIENTKTTAPNPWSWTCFVDNGFYSCKTSTDSEDYKSKATQIDNTSSNNKKKLGVGFVLAQNEELDLHKITLAPSTTITLTLPKRSNNLVEYYKLPTSCNLKFNNKVDNNNVVTNEIASTEIILKEEYIFKAGETYTIKNTDTSPSSCTFSPLLSIKQQDFSGFVDIGFMKSIAQTAIPGEIDVSIVNADGSFETTTTDNNIKFKKKLTYCSSISGGKCTNFAIPLASQIFVRKGQTLIIHINNTITIETIKEYGLYIKTTPNPAIYCPNKKFRMRFNSNCNSKEDDFCKIGPEKCNSLSTSACNCNSDKFKQTWFSFFQQNVATDEFSLTKSIKLECPEDQTDCEKCLSDMTKVTDKGLYLKLYEKVCFDLTSYTKSTKDAITKLDALNSDLNKKQLENAISGTGITILPYFSAEKDYGVLAKPILSAFSATPVASNPSNSNQKLQLESTINSNTNAKIVVFFANNEIVKNNSSPTPCNNDNCSFKITPSTQLNLRNGEGLTIKLIQNTPDNIIPYNKIIQEKLVDSTSQSLYTIKNGNLMRNSMPYETTAPFNICKKNDINHPMQSAYQEIFCYNGDGIFNNNDFNPEKEKDKKDKAEKMGLKFELDYENKNIFLENCFVLNDTYNPTPDSKISCSTSDCKECNAIKIHNPNFTNTIVNNKIGNINDPSSYYICIKKDQIARMISGSYNISVAVKNEKDIIDYINIILNPILDLLYSNKKDCEIPLNNEIDNCSIEEDVPCTNNVNVTPQYCKNDDNCKANGKTYIQQGDSYVPLGNSNFTQYCPMNINILTKNIEGKPTIINSKINSIDRSGSCAECRPVKTGEIERLYEIIVGNNTFSNAVRIATALMIMFYGLTYLMGISKLNQTEIIDRIFKIGIVGLFIDPQSGWLWFNTLIIQPFSNGADYLSFLFASVLESSESKDLATALNNGDYSNKSLLFSTTNDIVNLFLQDETWKKIGSLFFFDLFGPFYAVSIFYIIYLYILTVANVLLVYVVAKLLMGVLFLVGPIFIVFLLFQKTKEYFTKWMNAILGYAFQQFFVIFALNFFNMLIYHLVKLVLGFKVCWDEVWSIDLGITRFTLLEFWTPYTNSIFAKAGSSPNLYQSAIGTPTLSAILCLYTIVHIMKHFMPKIADLANEIASGISAATGANMISGSINAMKNSFLNSYPIKTFAKTLKSAAFHGLDKALGVGPIAEKRKADAIKHRKEMLDDRNSISNEADKRLQQYKHDNALDFLTGKQNESHLKKQREQYLKEVASEKELSRGLKILGLSESELKNLSEENKNKAKIKARLAGFSADKYLNDKGMKIKDIRNHASLAGAAFELAQQSARSGGTLTQSLTEKQQNMKFDSRVSTRRLDQLKRQNPAIDFSGATNVRNNTRFESLLAQSDRAQYYASQHATQFKASILDPMKDSANDVGKIMANTIGKIGGGVLGMVGGLGVATGIIILAAPVLIGASVTSSFFSFRKNIFNNTLSSGLGLFKRSLKHAGISAKKATRNSMILATAGGAVGVFRGFFVGSISEGTKGLFSGTHLGTTLGASTLGAIGNITGFVIGGVVGASVGAFTGVVAGAIAGIAFGAYYGASKGASYGAKHNMGAKLILGATGFLLGGVVGAITGAVAGLGSGIIVGGGVLGSALGFTLGGIGAFAGACAGAVGGAIAGFGLGLTKGATTGIVSGAVDGANVGINFANNPRETLNSAKTTSLFQAFGLEKIGNALKTYTNFTDGSLQRKFSTIKQIGVSIGISTFNKSVTPISFVNNILRGGYINYVDNQISAAAIAAPDIMRKTVQATSETSLAQGFRGAASLVSFLSPISNDTHQGIASFLSSHISPNLGRGYNNMTNIVFSRNDMRNR